MARHSFRRADHIEYGAWLIADAAGGLRLSRAEPATKANERKIALRLRIPHAVFETPQLRVDLTFDGSPNPPSLVEVHQAVADAVGGFGLEVVTHQHQSDS